MGNKDTAIKNLEKAHQSPDIGQRGEGKITKTKAEYRAEFNKEMGGELKTITKLLKIFIDKLNTQGLISNADIQTLMKMLEQLIGSPEKDKGGDTNIGQLNIQPVLVRFLDKDGTHN